MKKSSKKKPEKRPKGLCITGCNRLESRDGWCPICYVKFKKGIFTAEGRLSPEAIGRQLARKKKAELAAQRKAGREERRKRKALEAVKSSLSEGLTSKHLAIIGQTTEGFLAPQYCERLTFWTNEAICFSRLFIADNRKCHKCKIHENSYEKVLKLMEDIDVKGTEITTTENEANNEPSS